MSNKITYYYCEKSTNLGMRLDDADLCEGCTYYYLSKKCPHIRTITIHKNDKYKRCGFSYLVIGWGICDDKDYCLILEEENEKKYVVLTSSEFIYELKSKILEKQLI